MDKGSIITRADFEVGMRVKVCNLVFGSTLLKERKATVFLGGDNQFALDFGSVIGEATHQCSGALERNTGRYPNDGDTFVFLGFDLHQEKIVLFKKFEFLINKIGISKSVLEYYRKLKSNQVRKIFWLKNDVTPKMIELLTKYGITESFQIINNEYIKRNKSTIKIGKFMQKKLEKTNWKLFSAEYAQLLSKSKQEGKVIITNKLTDMLCASDLTIGWGSCQSFEGGKDSRGLANLIYYLSSNMYLAAVENESGKKIFRQWIYLPKITYPEKTTINNKCVIFGRPYPNYNEMVERFIRLKFMENILHIKQHTNRVMNKDERERMQFNNYEVNNMDNVPYGDIKYFSYQIAYSEEIKEVITKEDYDIDIDFLDVLQNGDRKYVLRCLFCGYKLSNICEFNCQGDCGCKMKEDYPYYCSDCGCGLTEDTVHCPNGGNYCEDCFNEHFIYCCSCGEVERRDDSKEGTDGNFHCMDCWKKKFAYCEDCEETIKLDDSYSSPDGEIFCETCYDETFFTCEECGEIANQEDDLETINGKDYCNECANKLQKVG